MGGSILETLQEEYAKAYKPIRVRCEYFSNAASQIRQLLFTHFFNAATKGMLAEEAQIELEANMQSCLVDEQVLVATANQLKAVSGTTLPSLVRALDEHILASGLPLVVQDNSYQLKMEKPYPIKVQDFMQQFTDMLTAYRISLSICDIYFAMISYSYLDIRAHQACIDVAQQLQQLLKPEEEINLQAILLQAKANKKKINELLANVREGSKPFEEELQFEALKLTVQFEREGRYLQACYKKFPNNTKLSWLFFDGVWQVLLKNIANHLYTGEYTSSTLYGSLTIKPEFIAAINKEITQFYSTALTKLPSLKIELLMKAYEMTNQVIVDVKKRAAMEGEALIEAPPMIFATEEKSIYELIGVYYGSQRSGGQTDAFSWTSPIDPSSADNLGNESYTL